MPSSPLSTRYLFPGSPAAPAPPGGGPLVTETQLLADRQWAELRAQVRCEPSRVGPVLVPPKPQVELVVQLAGQLQFGIARAGRQQRYTTEAGSVLLTGARKPAYELEWLALSPEPVRAVHLFLADELLTRTAAESGLDPDRLEVRDGSCVPDALLQHLGLTLAQELQGPVATSPSSSGTTSAMRQVAGGRPIVWPTPYPTRHWLTVAETSRGCFLSRHFG